MEKAVKTPELPKKPVNGYTIHWWRITNNQAGLPEVVPGKATYRQRDRCWIVRNGGNTFSTSGGWKAPMSWIWTRDFETEALALAEARRHPVVLRLRDLARRIVSRLRRLRNQAFASYRAHV